MFFNINCSITLFLTDSIALSVKSNIAFRAFAFSFRHVKIPGTVAPYLENLHIMRPKKPLVMPRDRRMRSSRGFGDLTTTRVPAIDSSDTMKKEQQKG